MNKVLFCYTEIAEYFLACCRNLVKVGAEVFIIRFPLNKEAPFQFMETEGIKLIDRSKLNNGQLLEIVNKINPNLIICSGWIDKGYLKVCKKYFKKIPTVLTMDNHWNGNLKQKVASLISPFFLLKRFSHCWVPGIKQKQYALQLGFRESEIKEGFYCANTDYFHNHYFSNKRVKEKKFPKRFLFVGRYYEFKGITDLWNAFIELQQEQPNDWELWCLGAGDLKQIQHSKIKHFGFIQPTEMSKFIEETGVFILPSRFEPWAVVIHEFACAGFPILCSDAVGAAEKFVKEGKNGYIFEHNNSQSIKVTLKRIISINDSELLKMGNKSYEVSQEITLNKWSNTVLSFIR